MIFEELEGKTVFITGGTGFVGTALIERILRTLPDTKIVLLIRAGRRSTSLARFNREILKNNCFDLLRDSLGDVAFEEMVSRRVVTVSGDVSQDDLGLSESDLRLLGSCDIAIHSAATVSFDAPLDGAVEVNLLGPSRVARAFQDASTGSNSKKHFISVSTAYVAGSRRGDTPEVSLVNNSLYPEVDWQKEVKTARQLRDDIELKSRHRKLLEEFHQRARREIGSAGVALLADRTEKLRKDWVKQQMIELGRARATSLGWPDAYAYSKALGEIALTTSKLSIGITIVRPSIIESAMIQPYPGWIRGFRMAEPIIISFAKGLLKEFPGVPEGIIDVIPVDLVVSAILAAASKGPSKEIEHYHVASGSVNPLRYESLVNMVRSYFQEHPLYDDKGQPISLPKWSSPGRNKVQSEINRASKIFNIAEAATSLLPLRGSRLNFTKNLEMKKVEIDRALTYVELYGSYAECEANYLINNLDRLRAELTETELATFDFDPRQVDWQNFVTTVHLPSIVEHSRVKTTPEKATVFASRRADRQLKDILCQEPKLVAFDLENTVVAANVVDSFAYLATRHLKGAEKAVMAASLLAEAPSLLSLDKKDRGDFLRYFYRRYENAKLESLNDDSWSFLSDYLLTKAFPDALWRIREHRRLGHKTILITGALDFVVQPLSPLFDEIISAKMTTSVDGTLTGQVPGTPPIGEARAEILSQLARKYGFSERDTIAYADATSDLPMLERAGMAVCVNPELKLMNIARRRGWRIESWSRAQGSPSLFLPIAKAR